MKRVALSVLGLMVGMVMTVSVVRAQAPKTNAPAAPASGAYVPPWVQVTPTAGSRMLVGTENMEALFWRGMRLLRCAWYTVMVCHVLLTLWVIADIRKRRNGHWLFVVLTLLGGFCAAAVYALVRLGDKPA